MKTLWTHLVFVGVGPRRIGRRIVYDRKPLVVNGLFNQLFSLFNAIDLAKILGRDHIVFGKFYLNFNNKQNCVPLSRVIDLNSLVIPASDWIANREPKSCSLIKNMCQVPPDAVQILRKEHAVLDLEIGCCFCFPLPSSTMQQQIQRMRFHPALYQLVSSFLSTYPKYQVVHYRMENDFSNYFYHQWHFSTPQECRAYICKQYQDAIAQRFDPNIPTLVVSHYYKDPAQQRDHDLQWQNLIHFTLSPQQKQLLCRHLQVPTNTPMREVDAIIDYILCTTPNVCDFIGTGGSTFSISVSMFHNNQKTFLIQPIKTV